MNIPTVGNDSPVALRGRQRVAEATYEVVFDKPEGFDFVSGQYLSLTLPGLAYEDPRGGRRDYSIASAPGDNVLSIATRESESGFKRTLMEAAQGSPILIEGPYGAFTLPSKLDMPVVFIAGGIGITPFMSMLRHADAASSPLSATLLCINSSKDRAPYRRQLRELLGRRPDLRVLHHYGPHMDAAQLAHQLGELKGRLYYISGPPSMVATTRKLLLEHEVPPATIRSEEFSGYGADDQRQLDGLPGRSAGVAEEAIMKIEESNEGQLAGRSLFDVEALFTTLSSLAIISETDAHGVITFANDKFVEVSKYSREELLGQNHRILKSGAHPAAMYDNMWATISRGRLWRGILKNRAKDGSSYWVDTSIAPIMDEAGRVVRYISVRFPITERQRAEESLREREKQQRVLTNLSQEALASQDLPALLDKAVKQLATALDLEYAAVLKSQPVDLQQGGSYLTYVAVAGLDVTLGETVVPGGPTDSLGGFVLASGEPVIVEDLRSESRFTGSVLLHDHQVMSAAAVPIHGKDREFGVLEVLSTQARTYSTDDVSFIRAVANLLAAAARNQLDQRKDEFLGIASHELRTPLTSLKTYIQLLGRQTVVSGDERSLSYFPKINQQIDRLSGLISNLLNVSRINAGKVEYNFQPFVLADILRAAAEEEQLAASRHTIRLDELADTCVCADRDRIGQVVQNLLANAVKYSPDGGTITIRSWPDDLGVTVAVRDQGVGIARSEQSEVFERFFQGSSGKRAGVPSGLGLGLHIASDIIKRHEGRIWLESAEGVGSTFYFYLPAVNQESSTTAN